MVITEDDVSLYFSNPRIFIMAEKNIFGIKVMLLITPQNDGMLKAWINTYP